MDLLKCAAYLALTGVVGFFAGRLLPKRWFRPEKGWFRSFPFEKNGAVYEKLGIRKWHRKVPDMSRVLPGLMPAKKLSADCLDSLPLMIRETCAAEVVHIAVSIAGLRCLWMWSGVGGVTVTAIHTVLLNLPYILIQRYNRPRLIRLQQKLSARKEKKEGTECVF